jgi:hypothetical protein
LGDERILDRARVPGTIASGKTGLEVAPIREPILMILQVELPGDPHLPEVGQAGNAFGTSLS